MFAKECALFKNIFTVVSTRKNVTKAFGQSQTIAGMKLVYLFLFPFTIWSNINALLYALSFSIHFLH